MRERVWPAGYESHGPDKPGYKLWTRDESRPDPDDPTMLIVTRLMFKSQTWKCGKCNRGGRTEIVPYDGPDPRLPICDHGRSPEVYEDVTVFPWPLPPEGMSEEVGS